MLEREVENLLEQDLAKNKWIKDVGDPDRNVYRQEPRSNEEKEKLGGKFPDFILYESTKKTDPIAIIETKRTEYKTLEEAKEQGFFYAEKLNAKFLFLYNVNRYITYYVPNGKNLFIDDKEVEQLLSLEQLKKFNNSETLRSKKIKINSKNDLIEIFKKANNKLREAGITIGISRFTEFSNLLFLKLISELNGSSEFNISEHLLWDTYKNMSGDALLQYINNTVIPGMNDKFKSSESDPLFSSLKITDTVKLKSIINSLDELDLSSIDTDIKGDAFEYFIQKYNSSNNDLGEYFTPRHLVKFLNDILNPVFGEKIYDPFAGTGGMLITAFKLIKDELEKSGMLDEENYKILRESTIWGSEISDNARISKMNMILTGDGHSNIKKQDSFSNPVANKYDVVISNIPFNMDVTDYQASLYKPVIKNGNAVAIEHILKSLKTTSSNSRAAIIVPEIVLNGSNLKDLRRKIIKNGTLKGIVSLPSKVFLPYTEAKTSILIFSGEATTVPEDIFFYKIKNDGFTLTTRRRKYPGINDLDEFVAIHNQMLETKYHEKIENDNLFYLKRSTALEQSNNSLLLFKYDTNARSGWIKLKDILIREKIKNDDLFPTASITNSEFWGMPLGEDLWGENFFSVTSRDTSNYSVVKSKRISFNPSRANVGSFGINVSKKSVSISSAYPVFKTINKKYIPEYIFYQLTKNNDVIEQIISRCSGTVRQSLNEEDFLEIEIPICDYDMQLKITNTLNSNYEKYKKSQDLLFKTIN